MGTVLPGSLSGQFGQYRRKPGEKHREGEVPEQVRCQADPESLRLYSWAPAPATAEHQGAFASVRYQRVQAQGGLPPFPAQQHLPVLYGGAAEKGVPYDRADRDPAQEDRPDERVQQLPELLPYIQEAVRDVAERFAPPVIGASPDCFGIFETVSRP